MKGYISSKAYETPVEIVERLNRELQGVLYSIEHELYDNVAIEDRLITLEDTIKACYQMIDVNC